VALLIAIATTATKLRQAPIRDRQLIRVIATMNFQALNKVKNFLLNRDTIKLVEIFKQKNI